MPELFVDITKIQKIVSFDVSGIIIYLHEKAIVNVVFTCDNEYKIYRDVVLEGKDYTIWGEEDNYINEYIIYNINSIISNNTV